MKIFDFFKPKPAQPTIDTYGQASSGIKEEQIQDLKQFADYLGVDFEDYLEHLHPDVDFDDYSR